MQNNIAIQTISNVQQAVNGIKSVDGKLKIFLLV